MASLTVSNYLGMLQEDPDDDESFEGLAEALSSGDAERMGESPLRLMEAARARHERHGELRAVARLIALEATITEDDPKFRATLLKEVGRLRREELLDDAGAAEAYRQALVAVPGDEDAEVALEEIEQAASKWREIADRFIEEADDASDSELKASMLAKAATLIWQYQKKGKVSEVDRLFKQALKADPASTRAARLFAQALRSRKKWKDMANVLRKTANAARVREEKLNLFLAAARTYARKVEDNDKAAACYERVLDFTPGHEEALHYLVEFFTEREDWDRLVSLYEDALRSRQKLESEQGILLQIGMVHWRIREAPADAEPYFARLRKIDPAHEGMLTFYRDYLGELTKGEGEEAEEARTRLVTVLGDAQRVVKGDDAKLAISIEHARIAQETGATERAIDAWKAVQRLDGANEEAGGALRSLYRRGEKWNALVEVMRAELDALPANSDDENTRVRRIELLRELVEIYRDRLKLDVMVTGTLATLLEEDPHDHEALDQLAATYESMGRWNDLIPVLVRQSEATDDPVQKVERLMRTARLWIDRFANYNQATAPLEQIIEIEPENRDALSELKTIYTKKRAWQSLFTVLEKESLLASDPSARLTMKVELATLAGDRLHHHADAIRLWREVVAEDPATDGALESLLKLTEREKDWAAHADALEQAQGLEEDEKKRIKLLQRLGVTCGEHLKDPARASAAWKRVLELDPKNGKATRTLRESFVEGRDWEGLEGLYAETEDWDGLVDVLGNAAERTDDDQLKVELSFRAAAVYEDRIGNPERAFRTYERVLSVEPKNRRAAEKLIPIYETQEKWPRLLALHEVLLDTIEEDDVEARLGALESLRSLAATKTRDEHAAFRFASDAYRLAPDRDDVRKSVEAAAESAGSHARLAELYEARIAAEDIPEAEKKALRRRLASLSGTELGKRDEAILQLERILESDPKDGEAIEALDDLYRQESRTDDLRRLFLHRLEHAEDDGTRFAVLSELAPLEEDVLGDADAAVERYRAILAIEPLDESALRSLDRLATAAENWNEVATTLERRSEISSGDEERELTLRLADLRREKLDDAQGALDAYSTVLGTDENNAQAIAGVESLVENEEVRAEAGRLLEYAYESSGEHEKLMGVLRTRLAATDEPGERRSLRLRLAELAGALGDVEGAFTALEDAFLATPNDVELWERLSDTAEASGNHERLATAFSTAIEHGDLSDAEVTDLSVRVAEIYDVILGRPADAEIHHQRVLIDQPNHERAFLALKEFYTERERWDELQALYRSRIVETVDAELRLELLLQVCFLFEEILDDAEQAIRSYQEVLELEPGHVPSRRSLDRLYRRTERYRDLSALLREEHERTDEEPQRIAILFEIGELHELKLEEPGTAVDEYERVLELSPTHIKAQNALERLLSSEEQRLRIALLLEPLYESQGAWSELSTVLRVQLEDVSDAGGRLALLMRIAELTETKLHDPQKAFETLADAVLADPADTHARSEFARLCSVVDGGPRRAEVLEKAAEGAEGTGYVQAEIYLELGATYDEIPNDEKAQHTYERLIELDGQNPDSVLPAAKALERIHLAANNTEKLADAYRQQIRFGLDEEKRGQLLEKLGALLEQNGDLDGAVNAYRQRLDFDPGDLDALSALERLYTNQEAWPRLIETLRSRDAAVDDEAEQRELSIRIGAVYQEQLSDPENAIAAYNDALLRFGQDEHVLSSLASLYGGQERWQDLLEVREQQLEAAPDAEQSANLQFEMAELMRLRTGDEERSIELYAQVLRVLPGHEGTVGALDQLVQHDERHIGIEAARALVPHYEVAGNHGKLIGVLQVVAEGDDPEERLRSLRRAAEVADVGHDNPAQAFELMSRAVRAGTAEEGFEAMLSDVERFAVAAEKHEEHVQLLEEVAPEILDADLQTSVYMRAATVARERLDDSARARSFYQSVLENRPEDVRALDALLELQASDGDHPALRVTLRRKIELEEDVSQRIVLLERLAKLLEVELEDVPAAIDALEELLLEDEQRVATYEAQEALLTKAERWDDLAQLYERWLDAGVGNPVDLRHKLGSVAAKHLDDPYRAIDQWREALAMDGNHEPSISSVEQLMITDEFRGAAAELLEPVFLARMEWPRVVSALEARLTVTDDMEGRKEILRRLGQIHEDYLEDLEGALERYAALFREEPRDQDAWDTLGRLGRVLEMWERLADIYRGPIDEFGVGDDDFARLAKTAARLYDERVGNLEQTASLYEKVLDFDETDREAFDALRSAYTRAERSEDLLKLLRRRVDVADSDDERLELLHTIAELHQVAGDTSAAIDVHQEAVQHMPSDARSVEALDTLLTESERFVDLAEHLRFRVDAAEGTVRSDLELRLGRLTNDKLEDVRGAVDVYEETIVRDPGHVGTITALEELVVNEEHQGRITELLEPIYRNADEWKKLVAILEARAMHAHRSDQVPLFSEIGKMHEERGNDSALAFHAWSRAFAADAADEGVRSEVDRLASALGAWDEHVASYEVAIRECDDPDIQSQLLMTVAQTHDTRRGDPRAAIETYERLAAHDETDLAALDALEGLHTMVGDWRGLVDVLTRKVARRFDPIERAELLRRSASVLEELLGDPNAAIKEYEKALEEDPEDAIALESLDRLLGAASRSDELAVILQRRSEIETDEEVRVEVGLRLGQLTETQLNKPNDAIDAFTRVLDLSPTQPIAIESLGRLYERQAMWPELLDNLQVRASTAQASDVRLSHVHRAGEVYERELDDVHEAIMQYQQALELDARHEPSLAALIRISRLEDYRHQASEILEPLLHVQERWDDLAELYRTRAEGASDSFDRKADYLRLAEVEENGRRDLVASFNATAAAFGEDPNDEETASRLERLAGETNAYDKLVEEFGTRAASVMDPEVARNLYWRVARIAEDKLSDDERAIGAYQHALEQAGDDREALEALDRLFVKGEQWSSLGEVVERRITLCDDPTARADLLIRLGELREGHFGDKRGAFAAYQEVLERDPGDGRATEALERLGTEPELALDVIDVLEGAYRDTGALERVAGLYTLRVNLADTDGERVRILQEASQLWESELGRPEDAFASLRRAAELDPLDDSMLDDLERLAHACGKRDLLRGFAESVVENGSASGRALRDVHVRAARWYTDGLGDHAAAEIQLRAALAIDDGATDVHGRLVELLRGPGREAELVTSLKAWAAADSDDFNKVERLLEAARLSESAVGDRDAAAECYDSVLALEPGHEAALRALTQIREDEEKWDEVAGLLTRRIDLEMDPAARVDLRRRVATLLAGPLANPEEATRAWEGVLDEEPADMQAIGELETLYEAAERWEELRELLDRRLDAATTDGERVSARVRLARLAERAFGRRDDALDQLRGVLEIDPQNGEALDELERLLTLEEDWEELVSLLERRAGNANGAGDWPAERDALSRIANLHEEHRNDAHSALEIYGMILTSEPGHVPSLQRVVAIHEAAGHIESAADALERLAPHLEAGPAAAAYQRLATIAEEQLSDAPRALAALRRAYELQPTATTRELLRTHHEHHENWTEYAMLLDAETAEVEEPEAQAALLKRIADVYFTKLEDPGSAATYLERASRLAPDDREILLPLCDLYIAAGRQSDAVPVLRQIIESFGGRRSKELAQYHHRLGKAVQGMGDAQGAMEHFDAAFRIDLTNVAILRDLGKLALDMGDLARAQKTFRALLLQKLKPGVGITKADVYFYLGSIANQEGDARKAVSMLERAMSEDAEHEAAKALLSTLK